MNGRSQRSDRQPPPVPPATHFNFAQVSHNGREFFLALAERAGESQANLIARFATSPQHAKELAVVLTQQIQKYEQRFGAIQDPGGRIVRAGPGALPPPDGKAG